MLSVIICVTTAVASETVLEEQKVAYGLYQVAREAKLDADVTFDDGLSALFERAWHEVGDILTGGLKCIATVLIVSVLCGLVETFLDQSPPMYLSLVSALSVMGGSIGSVMGMFHLGQAAIEEVNAFSKVLLPSLITAGISSGTPLGATAQYSATILFSDVLTTTIISVFLPLIKVFLVAVTANAAFENQTLGRIADFLKWIVSGSLKLFLMIFVGYLTTSGLIAATGDMVGVKTAKFAITGVVPVVGGILADAGETVVAGAMIIKNSIGIVGLLGIFSIILTPFLTLGINYFLFKIASVLTAPMCNQKLGTLIEQIGGGIGIVFGMTCTCVILLFISIVSGMFMIGLV